MVKESVRTAGLALLGVVAVGLTATTLPTAQRPARSGSGGARGSGQGSGSLSSPIDSLPQLLDLPFLAELVTALLVLTLLAVLWVLYTHRRAAFHIAVLTIVAGIVAVLILQLASPTPMASPGSTNVSGASNVSGVGGETGTTSPPSLLSFVLVAVVGAALLGTAVAANRRRSDDGGEERDADDLGGVAAVGRAAGRAADRIEEAAELDNEVYRAWREMTAHLDVSRPETHTAREFERAAVAAGMERSDVAELTDLFERVRYDDYEVGEGDEQRAVELLRRIESRYAEDGS